MLCFRSSSALINVRNIYTGHLHRAYCGCASKCCASVRNAIEKFRDDPELKGIMPDIHYEGFVADLRPHAVYVVYEEFYPLTLLSYYSHAHKRVDAENTQKLISGLALIHKQGLSHGDINSKNIVLKADENYNVTDIRFASYINFRHVKRDSSILNDIVRDWDEFHYRLSRYLDNETMRNARKQQNEIMSMIISSLNKALYGHF